MSRLPVRDWITRARRFFGGLAGQMLGLSVAGVLTADALLLGPSLGNFHDSWIRERVDAAQIAALAVEAAPQDRLAAQLERELLANARVTEVTLHRGQRALTLRAGASVGTPERTVDLRRSRVFASISDGVSVLVQPAGLVRVLAAPQFESGSLIEVVLDESQLKRALGAHARRAFVETLLFSAIIGGLLYAALFLLLVRRIRRLTTAIEAFGRKPDDVTVLEGPHGDDEIGRAGEALGRMGEEVRTALRQKERLAGLGAAVAKIAHDLRNNLAAAQLVSERLAGSDDPKVRQSAPRLERAIARAAALAEAALRYGKAEEPRPVLQIVDLVDALEEAAADALVRHPHVVWTGITGHFAVRADPDSLHRILANLVRNAAEAAAGDAPRIWAKVEASEGTVRIDIADNGPGIAPTLRERLFQPFATAQRPNGSGLGLAIARELARAMGGDVVLAPSETGACFRVTLPAA